MIGSNSLKALLPAIIVGGGVAVAIAMLRNTLRPKPAVFVDISRSNEVPNIDTFVEQHGGWELFFFDTKCTNEGIVGPQTKFRYGGRTILPVEEILSRKGKVVIYTDGYIDGSEKTHFGSNVEFRLPVDQFEDGVVISKIRELCGEDVVITRNEK